MESVGEERTGTGDGGARGGLPAIPIERRVSAISSPAGVGPGERETTELDVFLHVTNA